MALPVEGDPGTGGSGDSPGDWIDTRGLGSFMLIFSTLAFTGTTGTLDWFVEGGTRNAAGTITLDGAATALIPKSSFTQVLHTTAYPNIQIKSFRQGGDLAKWPRYIRTNMTVGGTGTPVFTARIELTPDAVG